MTHTDHLLQQTGTPVDLASPDGESRFTWPWHRNLAWRLATTYLATTLLILITLSLAIYFFTNFYIDEQMRNNLTTEADFYAAYVAYLAPEERILIELAPTITDLFAPQDDTIVRIFSVSNGMLLAATQDIGAQPSETTLAALQYRSPTLFTRASHDLPQRRYAAQRITVGDEVIGVVEISKSTATGQQFLSILRYVLAFTSAIATAVFLIISIALGRRMSQPIRAMDWATRHIATGDLNVRLDHHAPDEIGRLAESINTMTEQLQHLEAARVQFIGEITHDLRTPLTAIKGLLINLIDAAEPDQQPTLEIAEKETDRLIRLVNQLLDFCRWQGGQLALDLRRVNIGTITEDAVTLSLNRAKHRDIQLFSQIPPDLPSIMGDSDRLKRVILNLLDNAIKFTPAGGQVTLTAKRLPNAITISVEDTGRGMDEEEQRRAFESYYRGQGGGAGLGLTIARAIIEAHGGKMWLRSQPRQGTCVWLQIPLQTTL